MPISNQVLYGTKRRTPRCCMPFGTTSRWSLTKSGRPASVGGAKSDVSTGSGVAEPQLVDEKSLSARTGCESSNAHVLGAATGTDSSRWRPRQDSNLRTRLRRAMLYPLSYEGRLGRVAERRASVVPSCSARVGRGSGSAVNAKTEAGTGPRDRERAVRGRAAFRVARPAHSSRVKRPGQRDRIGTFGSTIDEALIVRCGQRRDDALELGDARFEIGPTDRRGGIGGSSSVSIELGCLHDG